MRFKVVGAIATLALIAAACSGADGANEPQAAVNGSTTVTAAPGADESSVATTAPSPNDTAAEPSATGPFDRASFVLCPALEDNYGELGLILGFETNLEESKEVAGDCFLEGMDFSGFASIALAPAFVPSIEFQARGYEGEKTPAPELGDGAVYVEDLEGSRQPHVVFSMGEAIVDVGAAFEVMTDDGQIVSKLNRDVMIEYALRVKELRTEANA
jgi:hypothetical protein